MIWGILGLVFVSLSVCAFSMLSAGSSVAVQYSDRFSRHAEGSMREHFLAGDGKRLLLVYLLMLFGLPTAAVLLKQSWVIVVGLTILMLLAPRRVSLWMAKRRRQQINASLPDGLAQIAGAMRAGLTFTMAMQSFVDEQKGPLGQEFSLVLREQRLGARLETALDNLGERVQTEEMDLFIVAALIAQDIGGNLADTLERLSDTLRRKLEMEGKIRALTAQGVIQGRLVTFLPFALLLMLNVIEPEAIQPIWSSLLGWCFLSVIIVLQFVGSTVIRKIVSIEV